MKLSKMTKEELEQLSYTNIAKLYYPNAFIQVKKDLAGKDRYIFIINE